MQFTPVDFTSSAHCHALVSLMDMYATDIMGGGEPLADRVKQALPVELAARPFVHAFLLFDGEKAAGLAICFEGFSTFAGKPLLNIHDLAIAPEYRNRGVSQILLSGVEAHAKTLN